MDQFNLTLPPPWRFCIRPWAFCYIAFIAAVSITSAQEPTFRREIDTIPVISGNNIPVQNPFAGGLTGSKPTFVDIDGDGDQDLFIGVANRNIRFYRNNGPAANPRFIPDTIPGLDLITTTTLAFAPAFADIDNDGDFDLFVGRATRINFYENTGNSRNPAFSLKTANFESISIGNDLRSDLSPVFVDIDNDKDFDLLAGESAGNISFFRNVGDPVNYRFRPDTTIQSLGSIDVGFYSAPTVIDIDNDRDFDLFIGERVGSIRFYRNIGDSTQPRFSRDPTVPGLDRINVGYNAAPTFFDIDNDGNFDLFIGEQDDGISFYRNTGQPNRPEFNLNNIPETEEFISIDNSGLSTPAFAGVDNDSDFDLLIGQSEGGIRLYRNTGAATRPEFSFVIKNFVSVGTSRFTAPAFADIDNDKDLDLFSGTQDGTIVFYRNLNPGFSLNTIPSLASISVGSTSRPALADIDADGDFDLFVGEANGNINFYRNDGNSTQPAFGLVTENFAAIDVGDRSSPTFADLDKDGDLDLFVGEEDGNINFYRNNGTPQNHSFVLVTTNFADINVGATSAPTFIDIDGDGDLDLFVGENTGGLYFYRNNSAPIVANPIPNQILPLGGTPFTRELNTVFTDPEGDALTYTATSSAANIAMASIAGSTLTVTAVAGGSATITVTADDGKGGTVSLSFMVTVNRRPTVANAIADFFLTLGKPAFVRDLNTPPVVFRDEDNDSLSYAAISSNASFVTASISERSKLTIAAVAAGKATITVTANDGRGGAVSMPFTVTVNRSPVVANAIPNQTLTVGGVAFTRNLTAAPAVFSDSDGDTLTYTASSNAANIATAGISGSTLTVTAVAGGSATITVTANDGKGETVSTTFTVTVNRRPVAANPIGNQIITLGKSPFTQDLKTVFTDPDGEALTFTASSSATNIATATISGSTLTVAPVAAGTAAITITANDGRGGAASTQFTVKINRAPFVANSIPDQLRLAIGATFTRDLNAAPVVFRDLDNDTLRYTAASSALNIATATITGSILTVASVAPGNATIKVKADDRQGGIDSTTFMVTVVRNVPPTVSSTPPLSQPSGQTVTIQATITDDNPNVTATLRYRRGGDVAFSSTPMSATGNTFQGTIPGSAATSRGMEYVIVAKDSDSDTSRLPAKGVFSIAVQTTNEAKPAAQVNGSEQTTYRLISVPIHLDNPSAANVLEDDLGPYNPEVWRLFGLMANQPISNRSPYVEFPNAGALTSGQSLFLIVRDAGKVIDAGPGQSVKTDQEFRIALASGHNFIAAPFNFTIPVTKLRLKSGGAINLRTYLGEWKTVQELTPWEGYYLPNNSTTADTLLVNPNLSSSSVISKKEEAIWRVQILASCDQARDTENFAGVAATSEDGWDDNDLVEPPPIGDYVSVYFPHEEWQKPLVRYIDDIRSASNPNQKWRFVVESNIANEMVTLRFDGLQQIEPSLAVYLVDEALNYKQNLRENATYQYQPRSRENTKAFTLIVGKEDFISEQAASVQGAPENFVLEQNFPNPFSARGTFGTSETGIRFGLPERSVVTIKIFDLAGCEIATLLDRAELPAGRHQRVWDGRDTKGRVVTSGIYFYRLVAGSFSKTMKLIVMR